MFTQSNMTARSHSNTMPRPISPYAPSTFTVPSAAQPNPLYHYPSPFSPFIPELQMRTGSLQATDLQSIKSSSGIRQFSWIMKQILARNIQQSWFEKETLENKTKLINLLQMGMCYNEYGGEYREHTIKVMKEELRKKENEAEERKRKVREVRKECEELKEYEGIKRKSLKQYKEYLQSLYKCGICQRYVKDIRSHKAKHEREQQETQNKLFIQQHTNTIRPQYFFEEQPKPSAEQNQMIKQLIEKNKLLEKQIQEQSEEMQRNKEAKKLALQKFNNLSQMQHDIISLKIQVEQMNSFAKYNPMPQMDLYQQIAEFVDKKIKEKVSQSARSVEQTPVRNIIASQKSGREDLTKTASIGFGSNQFMTRTYSVKVKDKKGPESESEGSNIKSPTRIKPSARQKSQEAANIKGRLQYDQNPQKSMFSDSQDISVPHAREIENNPTVSTLEVIKQIDPPRKPSWIHDEEEEEENKKSNGLVDIMSKGSAEVSLKRSNQTPDRKKNENEELSEYQRKIIASRFSVQLSLKHSSIVTPDRKNTQSEDSFYPEVADVIAEEDQRNDVMTEYRKSSYKGKEKPNQLEYSRSDMRMSLEKQKGELLNGIGNTGENIDQTDQQIKIEITDEVPNQLFLTPRALVKPSASIVPESAYSFQGHPSLLSQPSNTLQNNLEPSVTNSIFQIQIPSPSNINNTLTRIQQTDKGHLQKSMPYSHSSSQSNTNPESSKLLLLTKRSSIEQVKQVNEKNEESFLSSIPEKRQFLRSGDTMRSRENSKFRSKSRSRSQSKIQLLEETNLKEEVVKKYQEIFEKPFVKMKELSKWEIQEKIKEMERRLKLQQKEMVAYKEDIKIVESEASGEFLDNLMSNHTKSDVVKSVNKSKIIQMEIPTLQLPTRKQKSQEARELKEDIFYKPPVLLDTIKASSNLKGFNQKPRIKHSQLYIVEKEAEKYGSYDEDIEVYKGKQELSHEGSF